MAVDVENTLASAWPAVEDQPVFAISLFEGDFLGQCDQVSQALRVRCRQGGDIGVMFPWYHQNMQRRLGVDVAESDRSLTLTDQFGLDFAAHESAKQAVGRQ
jgi:hypothetical protein